jgi:hypothetical protein
MLKMIDSHVDFALFTMINADIHFKIEYFNIAFIFLKKEKK